MNHPTILAIVSYRVFPAVMGGQKCVDGFYRALSQHCTVWIAAEKSNADSPVGNARVLPFLYQHKTGIANIRWVYRLYQLIKKESIDLIIIEHSYFGWLGILLRRLSGKKFVIRSHNIETLRFRDMRKPLWRIYGWYEQWVHRAADKSFFITGEEKEWAISKWQLLPEKCETITYGVSATHFTTAAARQLNRTRFLQENQLSPDTVLFFFNGSMDYLPNRDALHIIVHELIPRLHAFAFAYRIIICGSNTGSDWKQVLNGQPEIIFRDFVNDIDVYYSMTDCFINPVTLGTGIKIKLMDALSFNMNCISCENGARGIPINATGEKMQVISNYNWQAFAEAMYAAPAKPVKDIPEAFYQLFDWESIVQRALISLQAI